MSSRATPSVERPALASSSAADSVLQADTGATAPPHDRRTRSKSLSVPWLLRPKASSFSEQHSSQETAIDDSCDSHDRPAGIKNMLRRASHSIKALVHRRPSTTVNDTIPEQHDSQPSAPNAHWRLRLPAHFRRSPSFGGFDLSQPGCIPQPAHASDYSDLPMVTTDDESLYTPGRSGPASKALENLEKAIYHIASNEDNRDGESGIGITAPGYSVDSEDESEDEAISKIDFVEELPGELVIHVLANLDAQALARSSRVSKAWEKAIRSQHVWRESCMRETNRAYAASEPIRPNVGLGVPPVQPENDWKKIYKMRQELEKRWKEGRARPVYLSGHTDSIYCLQFDEHKIISGSRDQTIRVWDMHTLQCKIVLGPPQVVNSEAIQKNEDGEAVHYATGPDNSHLNSSNPMPVWYAMHHTASILCLQYDDEILVTGSSDATAIVYDIKNGYKPIRRLRQHTAPVLDVVFDKKHIVTCSKDSSICVWDRQTGDLLRQLSGHKGPINAIQMRGSTLVSSSGDFLAKLWNVNTGKVIRELTGHTKGLACSQFTEDGRYVASAGTDKVIRVWDANTGECLHQLAAHENLVRSLHVDCITGRLISASYDQDIKVWDMQTGQQLLDFPRWHSSWVLSAKSDYRRIVSTGHDPKILIMDFGADIEGIEQLESNHVFGM